MFNKKTHTPVYLFAGILLIATALAGCKKEKTDTVPATVTDIDGNIYHTVTIGTQTWMLENLKVTRYRNGDPIPHVNDDAMWGANKSPAYCNYDKSGLKADTFGRLYNWYAVNEGPPLAPEGWHVPSGTEWNTLIEYLGGTGVAGSKIKEAGTERWAAPNAATNESGFSALPGGWRTLSGVFGDKGMGGYYWSSTENGVIYGANVQLSNTSASAMLNGAYKEAGFSVRCIKN